MRRYTKKKRRCIIWGAVALLAFLAIAALDVRMTVRRYEIDAEEISSGVRIALVTDLHSCSYGEGQRRLIDALRAQDPDLVLLGGDIFDDDIPDDNAELFLAGITDEYPCYYVSGNHEYWSGAERFAEKMAILKKHGVRRLSGECEQVEAGGATLNICGVDDPEASQLDGSFSFESQLEAAADAADNGAYTLLLTHRPERIDTYARYGFDLVLCGHAHGGQWRLPGIINGIYAPDQGILPEYAGGKYETDGTVMIVSRGLARESTRVPRIFNRPELVIVDIH